MIHTFLICLTMLPKQILLSIKMFENASFVAKFTNIPLPQSKNERVWTKFYLKYFHHKWKGSSLIVNI